MLSAAVLFLQKKPAIDWLMREMSEGVASKVMSTMRGSLALELSVLKNCELENVLLKIESIHCKILVPRDSEFLGASRLRTDPSG